MAVPSCPATVPCPTHLFRKKKAAISQEKLRIAAAAANLVQEGQCVLLDSGTTTTAIARALKRFSRLTIITNAVNIAGELSGTDFEVLLTGGSLRNKLVLARRTVS